MSEYFFILLGTALVNNVVLVKFLGLCPFMGVSNKLDTALGMGFATTFVLTIASVSRPVKELKGFQKISLRPGEKKQVTFSVTPEHLMLLDRNLEPVVETGSFEVMIGSSSQDIRLAGRFMVK